MVQRQTPPADGRVTRVLQGFTSTSATPTDTLRVMLEPLTPPKAIRSAGAVAASLSFNLCLTSLRAVRTVDF